MREVLETRLLSPSRGVWRRTRSILKQFSSPPVKLINEIKPYISFISVLVSESRDLIVDRLIDLMINRP